MSKYVRIASVIVALGVGVLVYQIYDFQSDLIPRMEGETSHLEAQLTQKEQELKKLKEFSKNIEKIKQDLRELNSQLESSLEHMPRAFNLSELLRKLNMIAQNSGIDLATFKPHKSEDKEAGSFYSTVKIDFDLRGTFSQTLVFVDQLSRLKRIVNVDNIKIHTVEGASQQGGLVACSTEATIRTFRFAE